MARYAGTSGRLKLIAVSPSASTDEITFTGTTAARADVISWDATVQLDGGAIPVTTFETTANAQGALTTERLRGGVESWTASVSCVVEGTLLGTFVAGTAAVFDFLYRKSTAFGHQSANGVIKNVKFSTGVDKKTAVVSFDVDGHGAWPAAS